MQTNISRANRLAGTITVDAHDASRLSLTNSSKLKTCRYATGGFHASSTLLLGRPCRTGRAVRLSRCGKEWENGSTEAREFGARILGGARHSRTTTSSTLLRIKCAPAAAPAPLTEGEINISETARFIYEPRMLALGRGHEFAAAPSSVKRSPRCLKQWATARLGSRRRSRKSPTRWHRKSQTGAHVVTRRGACCVRKRLETSAHRARDACPPRAP